MRPCPDEMGRDEEGKSGLQIFFFYRYSQLLISFSCPSAVQVLLFPSEIVDINEYPLSSF